MSGFPQSMIKFKYFWLRNQSQIKNQSRGTLFFAPFKFCPFLVFLGQKWTKKRPDPIFLELCECFLMSYMICQKVEKFSLQNMAREAISLVWGVWPLNRGSGGPGGPRVGNFHWPQPLGIGRVCFQEKIGGSKFLSQKGLSDCEMVC